MECDKFFGLEYVNHPVIPNKYNIPVSVFLLAAFRRFLVWILGYQQSWWRFRLVFSQSLQANAAKLPQIRPYLIQFIIPKSLYHLVLCKLLILSLNKCIPFSCCWWTTATRTSSDWRNKSSQTPCTMTDLKLLLPTSKHVWISLKEAAP